MFDLSTIFVHFVSANGEHPIARRGARQIKGVMSDRAANTYNNFCF